MSRTDEVVAAIDAAIGDGEAFRWMPTLREHDAAAVPGRMAFDVDGMVPSTTVTRPWISRMSIQLDAAMWVQAIERARASLLELAPAIQRMMRPFAALFAAPPAKYTAPQAHYGVRRVTARQYRAWKRMQGRRP